MTFRIHLVFSAGIWWFRSARAVPDPTNDYRIGEFCAIWHGTVCALTPYAYASTGGWYVRTDVGVIYL